MLRADAPEYTRFGEIYFSEIHSGAVKAWKRHRLATQRIAVPVGQVLVAIYDDRADSPSRGGLTTCLLGRQEYALLVIPNGLWYGFQGVAAEVSLIANCADRPHDASEAETRPVDSDLVPYEWPTRHAQREGSKGAQSQCCALEGNHRTFC